MNTRIYSNTMAIRNLLLLVFLCFQSLEVQAAATDLASQPLASTNSTVVRPNILFTLDDSGSMDWAFNPDYAGGRTYSGGSANHCKYNNSCNRGEVPFEANEYNALAYNPRITYKVPVNADGTFKPSQTCANTGGTSCAAAPYTGGWSTVRIDGFNAQSTGTVNITTGIPEVVYSVSGSAPFKKSGVDTNNPFSYRPGKNGTTSGAIPSPDTNDDPPLYSFPGSLQTGGAVVSTPYSGLLNQAAPVNNVIFNGHFDVSTSAVVTTLSNVTVSHSGTTVTVNYTPISPALQSGDTVIVSGSNCSTGYKSGGNSRPITVVSASQFTYVSNAGSNWSKTSCTVQATQPGHTATPPSITKSGNTVTVTLASASTPALTASAVLTVENSSTGTCDAGYRVSNASLNVVNSTTFTYTDGVSLVNLLDSNCKVTMTTFPTPASPGVSLQGTTVKVYLTGHGLVTGDVISVSDVTPGSCDDGYKTASYTVTRIDANTFSYLTAGGASANSTCRIDKLGAITTTAYANASTVNGAPYYFTMLATEYCNSIYLTVCVASSEPTGAYIYPAPVRFCKDNATALLPPGDASAQGAANCRAKYSVGTGNNFQYARYGLFWRGDIIPSRTTYGNEIVPNGTTIKTTGYLAGGTTLDYSNKQVVDRSKRTDCAAAPNCTYAEEMTNYANWYAYYRTRMQMMKSAAGLAFQPLNDRYRVGFVTINESSASEFVAMNPFNATQKTSWYNTFYSTVPGNSTPLRTALSHAGRYFAGKQPSIMSGDPVEYSCQLNFDILTTDGYWNDSNAGYQVNGSSAIGNYDNVDANPSLRSDGAYDGGLSGSSATLADVAMYYYKTDLRNSTFSNCTGALGSDVCLNNVPMTDKDKSAGLAGTQHMKVFSLGLADGLMSYQKDYESAASGDFYSIRNSQSGCTFSGSGTCNWPVPVADSQTALDDLWHAAVNGRGVFYQAKNPQDLSAGLIDALNGINVRLAAAAASATSSPVITQNDNYIYSSTYRTIKWDGEVQARYIDPATGVVITSGANNGVIWSAQTLLDAKVAGDSTPEISGRHIYMLDSSQLTSGSGLKDFLYSAMTTAEQSYFTGKCSSFLLTQCADGSLTAAEVGFSNDGTNMVNYLRGSKALETAPTTNDQVFRIRDHILGDTVNAKPVYIRVPQYSFADSGYSTFKTAQTNRQGVLYMAANDGMLHAFDTLTGEELWAYVPKMAMPNMPYLADTQYASRHRYFVDGSPAAMDVYVDAANSAITGQSVGWHTILVGGLGYGGQGYYALDVTDPLNPRGLWETCSDSTLCASSDADMGYSYGNAVITKRSKDGQWVVLVTSGYNNAPAGTGEGILYVLDAFTGAILSKTSTGFGTTGSPSGLSKISPLIDNISTNNTTRYVYGGDLYGNVWRFDLGAVGSSSSPSVVKIATLKDPSGIAQPVTSRPSVGDPLVSISNSLDGVGYPGIFVGTGRYLGTSDVSDPQVQTIYALRDDLSKTTTAAANRGDPRSLVQANAAGNSSAYPVTQIFLHLTDANNGYTTGGTVSWNYDNAGWFMDFVVTDASNVAVTSPPEYLHTGERVNLDPVLATSTLVLISNIPSSTACTIGGTSWIYTFDMSGNSTSQLLGNELAVGFDVIITQGSATEIGGPKVLVSFSGGEPPKKFTPPIGGQATMRSSWRELP